MKCCHVVGKMLPCCWWNAAMLLMKCCHVVGEIMPCCW